MVENNKLGLRISNIACKLIKDDNLNAGYMARLCKDDITPQSLILLVSNFSFVPEKDAEILRWLLSYMGLFRITQDGKENLGVALRMMSYKYPLNQAQFFHVLDYNGFLRSLEWPLKMLNQKHYIKYLSWAKLYDDLTAEDKNAVVKEWAINFYGRGRDALDHDFIRPGVIT